ncbi:hypothetical protein VNO78_06865 [Psophocarpus tetragonolobus]|uniref:Uncharacterized protein n=1 Tax=Psophocarpus tetragonolobus TaxID=3891 RepID=A0AAN9XS42_PSOTE
MPLIALLAKSDSIGILYLWLNPQLLNPLIRISANPIFSGRSKRSYSIRIWLDCWKSLTLFFSCLLRKLEQGSFGQD